MRKYLTVLAAVSAFGFSVASVKAEEAKKMEMTGVLIDNHCGDEMAAKEGAKAEDIQKSAEGHKKGCAIKCAKDGGLSLMSDGKMMKLDKASSDKAMEYLSEKDHGTKVSVEATKNDDGTLALAEIKAAEKKEEKKD